MTSLLFGSSFRLNLNISDDGWFLYAKISKKNELLEYNETLNGGMSGHMQPNIAIHVVVLYCNMEKLQ